MRVAVFSSQPYDKIFFDKENQKYGFDLEYFETHLGPHSLNLVKNFDAVCAFVNDKLSREVLEYLRKMGVQGVMLRCAGFNQLDLEAAKEFGIHVSRVPHYSPHSVAEHAVGLILCLNRKIHKAYQRVREQNFSLNGLLGFDLYGKSVGVVGAGNIGSAFAKIMSGFECRVLVHDPADNPQLASLNVERVSLDTLLTKSDIISLHCPLIKGQTEHIINAQTISKMKDNVMLINTSRGGLVDTKAVIEGLKNKKIGALGIDVYELEERVFYKDLSTAIIPDDVFQRLVSFPNVLITSHQAYLTSEALTQIAETTMKNLDLLNKKKPLDPQDLVI